MTASSPSHTGQYGPIASPPSMRTSAYRSRTWSRKSPRREAFPVIFATFPSSASNSPFRKTKRAARPRAQPPRKRKKVPANAAETRAAQERASGETCASLRAIGSSTASATWR